MKITLPIAIDRGYFTDVQADIVDVAPHLIGTFAVHRGGTIGTRGMWVVTHVETGAAIHGIKHTKAQAIRWATNYLSGVTPHSLAAAVRAAIKREPLASENLT